MHSVLFIAHTTLILPPIVQRAYEKQQHSRHHPLYTPIAANHLRGPSALPPPPIPRTPVPGAESMVGISGLEEAADAFRLAADDRTVKWSVISGE